MPLGTAPPPPRRHHPLHSRSFAPARNRDPSTFLERGQRERLIPALLAFLCILGTQVVFWTFTQPANRATANWTMIPDNWEALRTRWGYSHAASAVLNLLAFLAVTRAFLPKE